MLIWGDPLPRTQHPAFLPFIAEPGRSTHRNTEQQYRKGHEGCLVSRTGFCCFEIYIKRSTEEEAFHLVRKLRDFTSVDFLERIQKWRQTWEETHGDAFRNPSCHSTPVVMSYGSKAIGTAQGSDSYEGAPGWPAGERLCSQAGSPAAAAAARAHPGSCLLRVQTRAQRLCDSWLCQAHSGLGPGLTMAGRGGAGGRAWGVVRAKRAPLREKPTSSVSNPWAREEKAAV